MNSLFPAALKKARLAKNLNQEQLSELISVSRQTVSRYESGIIEPPIGVIVNLAKILEFSLDEIFGLKTSYDPTLLRLISSYSRLDNESKTLLSTLAEKLITTTRLEV
jgi:transcriptional regulator with XRE-family HTH domain